MDNTSYQQQANELSKQLWAIANDLRGNMDASKFKNYILGTIFYRYLSERTESYMKEIILKSLDTTHRNTTILGIICFCLILGNIAQVYLSNYTLRKQTEEYTDLMLEQQPDIQEFPNRKLGRFSLTWYSPKELGKPEEKLRTSTGLKPKEGRTIAVDPKIIPYGSIVFIQGYGYFIAEDCGGAIKENRIDIYTNSHEYAIQQGRKVAQVWILGKI